MKLNPINNPIPGADLSSLHIKLFNFVLRKLRDKDQIAYTELIKSLSGFRINENSNEKIKLRAVKKALWKLHTAGLITIIRERVRLGNIFLHADIFDEENKAAMSQKLSITQNLNGSNTVNINIGDSNG